MGAININDMRSRIRGLETDEMIVQCGLTMKTVR